MREQLRAGRRVRVRGRRDAASAPSSSLTRRIRSDGGGRRNDRRPSLDRGSEHDLRRRIRITNEPLILEPQNPSQLFFPSDDRRFDGGRWRRGGRSAGAGAGEYEGAPG
jgi:hypothetical protein